MLCFHEHKHTLLHVHILADEIYLGIHITINLRTELYYNYNFVINTVNYVLWNSFHGRLYGLPDVVVIGKNLRKEVELKALCGRSFGLYPTLTVHAVDDRVLCQSLITRYLNQMISTVT